MTNYISTSNRFNHGTYTLRKMNLGAKPSCERPDPVQKHNGARFTPHVNEEREQRRRQSLPHYVSERGINSFYEGYIKANWPAPKNVRAYTTKRTGGVSAAPYNSFNFSLLTGDNEKNVWANREKLRQELNLPQEPFWLKQEHTDIAICIEKNVKPTPVVADASFTRIAGPVCAVMTADCVPILVCDQKGSIVAAIHAGWKGIAAGVIASTIKAMNTDPTKLLAWLGPAIGPTAFEVNQDVREIFCKQISACNVAFIKQDETFLANIYSLASIFLRQTGVTKIYGGDYCTFTQKDLFFSYRRDGEKSGRMANLIWLADS